MNFAERKPEDRKNIKKKCDEAQQSKIPKKENDYMFYIDGILTILKQLVNLMLLK